MSQDLQIKCVVVGDGTVGKTCMLISYAKGNFPPGYVPTIFDNYSAKITIGEDTCQLLLFDTAGQEEFETLRKLSYEDVDIFLICFSVVQPSSFKNVEHLWINEIKQSNKTAPIILVGTKTDLRNNSRELDNLAKTKDKPISKFEGEEFAARLKCQKYVECSALTREGLKNVFDEAIITVLASKSKSKKGKKERKEKGGKCVLL
jgi:small GTP-binding protein